MYACVCQEKDREEGEERRDEYLLRGRERGGGEGAISFA